MLIKIHNAPHMNICCLAYKYLSETYRRSGKLHQKLQYIIILCICFVWRLTTMMTYLCAWFLWSQNWKSLDEPFGKSFRSSHTWESLSGLTCRLHCCRTLSIWSWTEEYLWASTGACMSHDVPVQNEQSNRIGSKRSFLPQLNKLQPWQFLIFV